MNKRKMLLNLTTLWLVVAAVLSSGCSKVGESEEPQPAPGTDLSIRLSAGLQAVTKAAVGTGTSFTASVGGWESAGVADYGKTASWLSMAPVTASESASDIALTPQQYYSQDGAERTYIKAWYPHGTLSGGVVSFAGDANYRGDGTDDILLSGEVSGSALDAATRTLAFGHLTTQFRFTVQGDALFGSTTIVKSVTLKGTGVPTGLDLRTNALVYDASAGVKVPGIGGTQTITEQVVPVGEAVMLPPFAGNTFRIDVQTSDVTYRDVLVTVRDDARTLPGKAYTIALTFAGYEITTQASVAEWDYTGTGSGDVTTD
jgi:lipoprotein